MSKADRVAALLNEKARTIQQMRWPWPITKIVVSVDRLISGDRVMVFVYFTADVDMGHIKAGKPAKCCTSVPERVWDLPAHKALEYAADSLLELLRSILRRSGQAELAEQYERKHGEKFITWRDG